MISDFELMVTQADTLFIHDTKGQPKLIRIFRSKTSSFKTGLQISKGYSVKQRLKLSEANNHKIGYTFLRFCESMSAPVPIGDFHLRLT